VERRLNPCGWWKLGGLIERTTWAIIEKAMVTLDLVRIHPRRRRFPMAEIPSITALAIAAGFVSAVARAQTTLTIVLHAESRGFGQGVQGTFETLSPLCPAGTFVDGRGVASGASVRVTRTLTCDDGSGTVGFDYDGVTENVNGPGRWRILSASGRYT
jgi:hypothetical protein